jgi:hypothetical protein
MNAAAMLLSRSLNNNPLITHIIIAKCFTTILLPGENIVSNDWYLRNYLPIVAGSICGVFSYKH